MQTYLDGLKYLARRKVSPGSFNSQEWQSVAPAIRQRSFFSATITSARVLHRMRSMLLDWQSGAVETITTPSGATETAFKETGLAKFRERAAELLISEGLATPADFKRESIQNVISASRLKLIFNTNTAQAQDFAIYQQRVADPTRINRFPAAEFVRTPGAKLPRPLHVANQGQIRRFDDIQFWLQMNSPDIGGFGVPWGPWGFNSYMTTFPVSRKRAEALGLVKPGERVMPPDLTQFGVTLPARFNKGVTAEVDDITPEIRQQAINTITARLGPQALRPDGKLTLEALQALRGGQVTAPAPSPIVKAPAPLLASNTRSLRKVIDELESIANSGASYDIKEYEEHQIKTNDQLRQIYKVSDKDRAVEKEKYQRMFDRSVILKIAHDRAIAKLRDAVSIPTNERGAVDYTFESGLTASRLKSTKGVVEGLNIVQRYTSKNLLPKIKIASTRKSREEADTSISKIYIRADSDPSTVAHEITHITETQNLKLLNEAKKFLAKRANGQKAVSLKRLTGINYESWEVAYEDEWEKLGGRVYTGKYYSNATEILTMGIERLHANPLRFRQTDPEYFEFIVKTLQAIQ